MKTKERWLDSIAYAYQQAYQKKSWRIAMWVLGAFVHIPLAIYYFVGKKNNQKQSFDEVAQFLRSEGADIALREKLTVQEANKEAFFRQEDAVEAKKNVDQLFEPEWKKLVSKTRRKMYETNEWQEDDYLAFTVSVIRTLPGFLLSLVFALPMYLFLLVVSIPTLYFIVSRLMMMVLVIIGVTVIVFTLLYLSPSDPAINILGEQATPDQINNFRNIHGLNDSYFVQLLRTIKGVFSFDLGITYKGNENVVASLLRRFPVTLELTLLALGLSVTIALPAGILAAVKANSTFEHIFMFVALIGISIPSFWQGLVFILTFSVNLGWLPATYQPSNSISLLMPAIVLGTGLMASVARMTRSSMLDVINEDYMLTARSKGLSNRRVILRHAVPNALIPIVTVIGLQFGGMLGGSAVTENVFTISGIGSYIVDKQFVPDIPAVMGGVIYIAIVLSLVNLFTDLLYSFIDPRIRSRIRKGQMGRGGS